MTAVTQRSAARPARLDVSEPPFARTDFSPEHVRFLELQPFLIAVALDADGRPWTAPLFGRPGFLSVPSRSRLRIEAPFPAGDPLQGAVSGGGAIGLIAVEFLTARVCRMMGRVSSARDGVLNVSIDWVTATRGGEMSPRRWHFTPWLGLSQRPTARRELSLFDADAARLLGTADTVFVGTLKGAPADTPSGGMFHMSRPDGLIEVTGQRELLCPEAATVLSPPSAAAATPAGLTVIDFDRGDILQAARHFKPSSLRGPVFALEAARWSSAACPLEWSTPRA